MSDGTEINFHEVKIENLNPRHVEELSKAPASLWDVLQIRNSIHTLGNAIQIAINDQSDNFTKALKTHTKECPIGDIDEIINKKIEEVPEMNAEKREKKIKRLGIYIAVVVSLLSLIISLKQIF